MDLDAHFSLLPKLMFDTLIWSVFPLSVMVISLLTVFIAFEEGIHVGELFNGSLS